MGFFLYDWCERHFVRKLSNKYFIRQTFQNSFLSGLALHGNLLQLLLEHCDFLHTDMSQDSEATLCRCGGLFGHAFVANLPPSLSVKEL